VVADSIRLNEYKIKKTSINARQSRLQHIMNIMVDMGGLGHTYQIIRTEVIGVRNARSV